MSAKFSDISLESDKLYFASPCGIGDTMIIASLKDDLEHKYKNKIHFLIKKSHKFLMDLYEIADYTIVDFPSNEQLELMRELNFINPGKIFIAHPLYINNQSFVNDFYQGKFSFFDMYLRFFDLPIETEFKKIKKNLVTENTLNNKLKKIGIRKDDNIILLAPEADSCSQLPADYWSEIAKKYIKKGYRVISNVMNKENCIKNTKYIPLTIEEAICIAQNCAGVISLRSGFCDIVAQNHKGFFTVLYPNINFLNLYSLKRSFRITNVEEQIVNIYFLKMHIYIFGIKLFNLILYKNFNNFKLKNFNKTVLSASENI